MITISFGLLSCGVRASYNTIDSESHCACASSKRVLLSYEMSPKMNLEAEDIFI